MNSLLEVNSLSIGFENNKEQYTVVNDVSFSIQEKEVVCVVGESGCGKSISCLSLLNLLPKSAHIIQGSALFKGNDLFKLNEKQLDKIRGNDIALISQDPLSSLDPLYKVGNQIVEALFAHQDLTKEQAKKQTLDLLRSVGLSDALTVYNSYPHTLSGGMRQRVMIALALANRPSLLLADEPTTALDVTIQAQIMDLVRSKKEEYGMSILLITHDMGVVASLADRVYVMYSGQIVESGNVDDVLKHPKHPYTKALIGAIPTLDTDRNTQLKSIEGNVPSFTEKMHGCRFAPRCNYCMPQCTLQEVSLNTNGKHCYRCLLNEKD